MIVVDNKKYATGLMWQPVGLSYTPRNYARYLTGSMGTKFNLFTEFRNMVGMGAGHLKHKERMFSAAAEIMDSFTEYSSFLAVFRVKEGFYLIAVRNGIVLKDELYDMESGARSEFDKLIEIPDWTALFAPTVWNVPKSVEKNIENVLIGNTKNILKPISSVKANLFSLFLFVLFIGGLGYFFADPIKEMLGTQEEQVLKIDPKLAEEYRKEMLEKANKTDEAILKKEVIKPLVFPYDNLTDASQRANLCYKSIAYVMQPVLGWEQKDAVCDMNFVTVDFVRTYGTISGFYEFANNLIPGSFVQEKSDDDIFVRAKLPDLQTYASLEERDANTVARQIRSLFQEKNVSADVFVNMETISNKTQMAEIYSVEILADSKLIPNEFIKIFNEFNGLSLERVEWKTRSKTWNYEVIIYAK